MFVLVALVCVAIPAAAQRGAITRLVNLEQLASHAEVIVRGQVIRARVEPHPQEKRMWTVVVTLRVEEALKGSVGEEYTFRQFIWDLRDRANAAGYRKGQALLLLMNKTTPYGLTSPTGLGQGRFQLTRDRAGRQWAVNGYRNAGLFHRLDEDLARRGIRLPKPLASLVAEHRAGLVARDDLSELIRRIVRSD